MEADVDLEEPEVTTPTRTLMDPLPADYMPEPAQIIASEDGVFMPAMFFYSGTEPDLWAIARFYGYDLRLVYLNDDDGAQDLLAEHIAGEYVVDRWGPIDIPGWRLVGKVPTGGFPVAMYITEAPEEDGMEDLFDQGERV